MNELIKIIEILSAEIVRVEEDAKEQFRFKDLTLTQMQYLETINKLKNPNITELAKELKLTKPTVTVAVDRLIEKGYVVKIHSDSDRRSLHLHLTEKGKLINQMHDFAHEKLAEKFTGKLNHDELKQLLLLTEKLIK